MSVPAQSITEAAIEAYQSGWTPVPLLAGEKRPALGQWTHLQYDSEEDVTLTFKDSGGIGLSLGEPSGGLVDVDLDHPKALRLSSLFLPPTPMVSGRASARRSHHWYIAADDLPEGTRRYLMPDGSVSVELRSTGGQTVIPPSIHPSGENYLWESDPWGGEIGPHREHGKVLAARVATLAMACVLVDGWPKRGSRHEAYLALAGGLLRYGTGDAVTVHPLWETALPNLIRALAEGTLDEDGADTRASEVMDSTMEKLRAGRAVQGFPTLSRLIGEVHVELVRRYAREIESILGHASRPSSEPLMTSIAGELDDEDGPVIAPYTDDLNPLDLRASSWEPVNLGPYLEGRIEPLVPGVLFRDDGAGLFYTGRVNCLYGRSESGKTWLSYSAAQSVIEDGGRVLYVDCEDDPEQTLTRMRALGLGDDDIRDRFSYVRPEEPIARLMVNRWGDSTATESSRRHDTAFTTALDAIKPDLIVVDGLSVLYGLHGLDTNGTTDTEKITGWMKALTGNGRRTVIIIDHTIKNAGLGATPLGSQHKVAMVQGVALQVHPITRPVPGRVGEVLLAIGKDRPGIVRQRSTDDDPAIAAVVTLDGSVAGKMDLTIKPPKGGMVVIGDSDRQNQKLSQLDNDMTSILDVLGANPVPLTRREIELALPSRVSKGRWTEAINGLKSDGKIVHEGIKKTSRYRLSDN